ncbi:hypothetical protein HMPREF3201_01839, partial [Megasphaera sp. MJR8396C]
TLIPVRGRKLNVAKIGLFGLSLEPKSPQGDGKLSALKRKSEVGMRKAAAGICL